MLWNVKMTKQAKATVIVILGLGILYALSRIACRYVVQMTDLT